jgi:flagellar hook-length control protein FliK
MTTSVHTNLFQLTNSSTESKNNSTSPLIVNPLNINEKELTEGQLPFSNMLDDIAGNFESNEIVASEIPLSDLLTTTKEQENKELYAGFSGNIPPLIEKSGLNTSEAINKKTDTNASLQRKQTNLLSNDLEDKTNLIALISGEKTDQLVQLKSELQQNVALLQPNKEIEYRLAEKTNLELLNQSYGKLDINSDILSVNSDSSIEFSRKLDLTLGPLTKIVPFGSQNDLSSFSSQDKSNLEKGNTFSLNEKVTLMGSKLSRAMSSESSLESSNMINSNSAVSKSVNKDLDILPLEMKKDRFDFLTNKAESRLRFDADPGALNNKFNSHTTTESSTLASNQQSLNFLPNGKSSMLDVGLPIDTSLTSTVKLETATADTAQIQKHGLNSVFSQGLNMKQNFAPNLAMRIQWMFNQALSSAEIMMDPPDMGPLTVKIQQHNGETNVMFQVAQSSTKELVEENLAKLKEMLSQQGIDLGEASVEQQEKGAHESLKHTNSKESEASDNALQTQAEVTSLQSDKLIDIYS